MTKSKKCIFYGTYRAKKNIEGRVKYVEKLKTEMKNMVWAAEDGDKMESLMSDDKMESLMSLWRVYATFGEEEE